MLSERMGPIAVGSGILLAALLLVMVLFRTDFPVANRIKLMPGYRVLVGLSYTFGLALIAFYGVSFAIVIFNIT